MAKFLSFKRTDPAATAFERSEHLVKVSSIVDVNQITAGRVTINLDNTLTGFDTLTIDAADFSTGFPVAPTWKANTAPLADMVNSGITANPGGVKVNVFPPKDSTGKTISISAIAYS